MEYLYDKILFVIIVFVLFLILIFAIRIIYWKTIKINHIAETKTSIGVTDTKAMKALKNVPGVWAQYVGNKCWNVCKTNDIGQEMMLDSRRCSTGIINVIRFNRTIKKKYTYQSSVAIKYKNLVKYAVRHRKKIKFVVLFTIDSPNDDLLEFEEMKFAIENKAIAWNPAPGKQTKFYWKWKNSGRKIESYRKAFMENKN